MEAEERVASSPTRSPDMQQNAQVAINNEADLSDDAIEKLLSQAEMRLVMNKSSQPTSKTAKDKREPSRFPTAPVQSSNSIARVDSGALVNDKERQSAEGGVKKIEDPIQAAKAKKEKKATAGADWFHMPRTDLTPQLKRDLQVLRMRNVLDPKRHYKKDNSRAMVPEFSQVGTIVEGPTDFYSGRLTKKARKRTLLESVLEGEKEDRRFKKKYDELNLKKRSGKKGHYKELLKKRYGKKTLKK